MREGEYNWKMQKDVEDTFTIDALRCQVATLKCENRAREREHKEECARQLMETHHQYSVELFAQDQQNHNLRRQLAQMQQKVADAHQAVSGASLLFDDALCEIDDLRRIRYRLELKLVSVRSQLDTTCTRLESTRKQLETTHLELFESIQTVATMEQHQQRLGSNSTGAADQQLDQQPDFQQASPSRRPVCVACFEEATLTSTCDGSRYCNNCRSRSGAGERCQYPQRAIMAEQGR